MTASLFENLDAKTGIKIRVVKIRKKNVKDLKILVVMSSE
jgi:hypothetical protein